ncbi:MAG: sugar phosphate isomerase/epimerase [Flavobacterium sp.]|nr:MAG: sugar phosphate isomerase/epimerase [Flavobacterium sp.]
MEIKYCCTHWGSETLQPLEFLEKVQREGYSGIEINLRPDNLPGQPFFDRLQQLRNENDFTFIGQMVLEPTNETTEQHTNRMKERLDFLMDFRPDFVNTHTGRDFFSFADNCRIIDAAENLAAKRSIPVYHETHRGRFSFHLATLIPYLDEFPSMRLTGDFSHWCAVSESLLQDQANLLARVIPHISHIHARVGSDQSAQVNNPFAPEWNTHLAAFLSWWKDILAFQKQKGSRVLTITPEAGPRPYMPEMPFSREPLAEQWEINSAMKNYLKKELY